MDDLERTQFEQILRLTKENNRMLHAMRRNAWLGGLFKVIFWIVVFVIVPFYIYMQYLAPIMGSMMQTLEQLQKVQGTGAQMQAQFGDITDAMKGLQDQFPQFFPKQQ